MTHDSVWLKYKQVSQNLCMFIDEILLRIHFSGSSFPAQVIP